MAAVHDCAPASRGSCRAGGTGPPAAFEFVPGYSFEALDAEELRIEKEAEQEERRVAREEQWATETLNSQVERFSSVMRHGECAGGKADATTLAWNAALAAQGLTLSIEGTGPSPNRGIVTTRPFATGEVLLRVRPTAAVLSGASCSERCHHCFAQPAKLMRCSACGHARYCSGAHQRAAWAAHRAECALLGHVKPRVPGATILLLARLLQVLGAHGPTAQDVVQSQQREKAAKAGASENVSDAVSPSEGAGTGGNGVAAHTGTSGSAFESAASTALEWSRGKEAVLSLVSLLDEQPAARRDEFVAQATMLSALLHEVVGKGGCVSPPPPSAVAEMLSRVSLNAHTLCDDELQQIGVGLYPMGALANHSCAPSAVQAFGSGGSLCFRALRPLRVGERVTIAYVELAADTAARRAALAQSYLFRCSCRRCEAPEPPVAGVAAAEAAAELAGGREAELAAIDRAEWDEALRRSERNCVLADALYPRVAPALALQHVRAGKLSAHAEKPAEAARHLKRAMEILLVTHGQEAALTQSVAEMLRDAQLELAHGS